MSTEAPDARAPVAVIHFDDALEARLVDAPETLAGPLRDIEVTIIRPCVSQNGLRYSPAVLQAAVAKFEGAAAFADHPDALDLSRAGGRSIRDLVGVYHSARYEPGAGIRARLRFLPSAAWAYSLVEGLIRDRGAGRVVPPIGISADLLVVKQLTYPANLRPVPAPQGQGNAAGAPRGICDVLSIERVNSADLVFRPAAGGSFDRIVEAIADPVSRPQPEACRGDRAVAQTNSKEVTVPENATANQQPPATPATPAPPTAALEAEMAALRDARRAALDELREARLAASGLPEPAVARIRESLEGRDWQAADLEAEIAAMKALLAAVSPSPIRGAGQTRVQMGLNSTEQITIALERLFGLPVDDKYKHIPRLSGIREAYLLLTGDYDFTGRPNPERAAIAREANETTLAVMDNVVSNVMNKRLVHDYAAQPKWWRPIVSIVDLKDMKAQTRVLLNDFGALATVAENGAYQNVAWGDTAETYTVAKRGNLVYVTMEAIINDDLRAFTRIPRKLAAAAAVTINEFVSGLFTTGSGAGTIMADGNTVFHASRNNLGSAALDATSLAAGIVAMLKYSNSAAKRIGVRPRYLLVPPDLIKDAWTIVNSTLIPGSPNNDANFLHGLVEPITVPNWTDANNWYLMADPAMVEGIEIGFLNGRETPELLVQDQPTNGTVFTNDAITWKVRWIFGGGWLDWRAAYGAIVT